MKTNTGRLQAILLAAALFCNSALFGQSSFIAYNVPTGVVGNQAVDGLVVGNDFHVVNPITISSLGVFSSGTSGIQGSTELTVQLFERSGRHLGAVLETLTFDVVNPGKRVGGSFFKPLARPLTLLPGNYTIAAYGFDTNNPEGNAGLPPFTTNAVVWTMNDGGGLIRFEGQSRYGRAPGQYPGHLDRGPANRYAAGTFVFSAGTMPTPPNAADFAALTAGVISFPLEDTRHLGSLAVLDVGAFPVIVEQGGNRLVLEAAGFYNGDVNGGRVVAFAHTQWQQPWERASGDTRLTLFENAIKWASRKSSPSRIVVGITTTNVNVWSMTNFDAGYFTRAGYQLVPIDFETLDLTNGLPPVDVLVLNAHARYLERGTDLIRQFSARGGGLVMSMIPRFLVYPRMRPAFDAANQMLQPFGLAYRSSLAVPADFGFTNIQSIAYPLTFNAFPAAKLLYLDREARIQLNNQERAIALNTINYTINARPDLLPALTAVCSSGSATNLGALQTAAGVSNFVDIVALSGAQVATNYLGKWEMAGPDLVAGGRRGGVEYVFNLAAADVYRLQIDGAQNLPRAISPNLDLVLSVDGINLGHHLLKTGAGSGGTVTCLMPYLLSGAHTLRVFWDNGNSYTQLRLQGVHVQMGIGPDSNGTGIKDWVQQYIGSLSGLDNTNAIITSYTSPVCLEGRDPYLTAMQLNIESSDSGTPQVQARPAGKGRWYADVPLSAYLNAQTILQASYQHGALVEARSLQWTPINLLADTSLGGSISIRKGDSLLLNALPSNAANGGLRITVGTNAYNGRTTQPIVCNFPAAGTFTVTGTYTPPQGPPQNGNLNVKVVEQSFPDKPACLVGTERTWDLPTVAPEAVLEADSRLICEQTGTLANKGAELNLLIDQNEPRSIIARLGAGGPILDSTSARGIKFWPGNETYTRVIQQYPDGSQLVEMMLVLSPMPVDITVRLDVVVGGVTFEDGTLTKTLSAADFDKLGQSVVRFIRPASARTSVCHSISIMQGSTRIGPEH